MAINPKDIWKNVWFG